jgi:hypothetical protein
MFAVTISFFLGASLISAVLYLLVYLGVDVGFVVSVDNWISQGTTIAGFAALFGLSVDAIRYLSEHFWQN